MVTRPSSLVYIPDQRFVSRLPVKTDAVAVVDHQDPGVVRKQLFGPSAQSDFRWPPVCRQALTPREKNARLRRQQSFPSPIGSA